MARRFPTRFPVPGSRLGRRGFSLLEVMVALAILTVSLVIMVETQSSAVVLTREAERVVTATDLAKMKQNEVMFIVEQEGFQQADVYEYGDFDDLGQDALDVELGEDLEDYHWEYSISEVDISGIGGAASAASDLDGDSAGGAGLSGLLGGGGGGQSAPSDSTAGSPMADMMGAMGFGPEQISEMLGPYIREVRVRVWWGDSSRKAEEEGFEVVIVSHVINESGVLQLEQGAPPL